MDCRKEFGKHGAAHQDSGGRVFVKPSLSEPLREKISSRRQWRCRFSLQFLVSRFRAGVDEAITRLQGALWQKVERCFFEDNPTAFVLRMT